MADLHIEDFYHDVASIFLRLYAVFPRKTILYVEDISGPDAPDEFGLHNPRFEAGFSAMVWLAEQGYLRFDAAIRGEGLDQAVLSQRALMLLTSRSALQLTPVTDTTETSPSVLEYAASNIAQLRSVVKRGSSIDIGRCVQYLLAQPALPVSEPQPPSNTAS